MRAEEPAALSRVRPTAALLGLAGGPAALGMALGLAVLSIIVGAVILLLQWLAGRGRSAPPAAPIAVVL